MGLTADKLVDALATCSGGEAEGAAVEPGDANGLAEIVLLVRHDQPTFAPTLLSAWQAEGRELSPLLQLELDTARARTAYYRSLDASIIAEVPGLTSVKGLEIIGLYPSGLARHMNDLDYVAAAETDLWQAASYLLRDGWELHTASFSFVSGSPQVMVSLRRPHEDPFQLPYGVELTTYYSMGNYGAVAPLLRLRDEWRSPAVKNMLMLLYERYEQRFRARDLVDTVVLHDAMHPEELTALHRAVVTLSLGVEYSELVELVRAAGLGSLPSLPGRRWTTGTIRARRMVRGASFFLRPLAGTGRQLQRRLITGEIGHVEGKVWDAVQRRLAVPPAISGGLLAFGLPLDMPSPEVTSTVLCRHGKLAWADTPIGRFLLTIGDYVSQDEVDELISRDGAGRQPASGLAAESRR
jgi:hypothetical protein